MVSDVSFADTMEDISPNRSTEVSVNGAQSTSLEVPLALAVVGEHGVGVLEEGDQDKMVIDDKVGDEVVSCNFCEATVHAPVGEDRGSDGETDVGSDDLHKVTLVEDGRVRSEV